MKKKFSEISKKGYINGVCKSYYSIERTFELEIGLRENEFGVPDYNGIKIKTRRNNSKSTITLYNTIPDKDELFEIERLKKYIRLFM